MQSFSASCGFMAVPSLTEAEERDQHEVGVLILTSKKGGNEHHQSKSGK